MKPKICIVVSKFNKDITAKMLNAAVHKLQDPHGNGIHGLQDKEIVFGYGWSAGTN